MNIFLRELKASLKSLIIWSAIVALFVFLGFSKFSAYYGNADMLKILDAMPPAMLDAMKLRAFNLTTVTGFYGIMYNYFVLILSIAATMWGSGVISKEERDKTVEFALTLPVTRSKLVTAKVLAALVDCMALAAVTLGVTLLGASQYEPESGFPQFLTISMVGLFIVMMIYLAVGVLLGCALKQYRRTGSIAISILLVTYFITFLTGINPDLEFLNNLSPFTYFNPVVVLNESKLDLAYVGLSVAIMVMAMVGAYVTYQRRDLYI